MLNYCFSKLIKPKFLELSDIKKQDFVKENPLIPSETTCGICGFLLDTKASGEGKKRWYYFIVDREYLFIRKLYSEDELKEMENIKDSFFYNKKYHEKFNHF